jgi:uncharacterized protein YndB with AHSA1/START domain
MKIEKRLELNVPPERVWSAITDPGELVQWFPDRAEVDLRPGGNGFFEWENHGRDYMRVVLVEPPTHLVWKWMNDNSAPYDDAVATTVEWTLTPTPNGGTILDLVETGFATQKAHEANTRGWNSELGELVDYLDKVLVLEAKS